jgi:hypothetical protein
MSWYLDGNNILGVLDGPLRREDSRERLLDDLLAMGLPKPATVVFDGPAPDGLSRGLRGKAKVIYSGRRTADDVIVSLVRPGDWVVTADRDLALRCRDRQARVVPPREFLSGRRGRRPRPGGEKPEPTAVDVNEWMRVFGLDPDDTE